MRRRLDAVLLLDKAPGASSNAALQEAKRLFRAARAGHAGTLDPLASGLLPLLFGEATKFARFALDSDKTYEAVVRLGVTTTTGDAEGEELARRDVNVDDAALHRALERFRGEIDQIPPMYSALKRGGRPLYELARQGRSVERRARQVTVHALELQQRDGALLRIRLRVSKGTYVRQLAADLGAVLGTGGYLADLRRSAVGGFDIARALTLEALQRMDEPQRDARLLPVESLLAELPRLELGPDEAGRFLRGQAIAVAPAQPGICRAHRLPGGALLGVGERGADGLLRPVRVLASPPPMVASG
jgi:tRNA pseudouridine55 synthase